MRGWEKLAYDVKINVGYCTESETGLYYLNARYYDSKIARFLSEDTYRGEPNDPLSLNLYTYALNNPIKYIDPTGHYVLQNGSRGDDVKNVQEMLDKLGYNTGGADGIFGKNTQAAVIQYQRDHGLQVDGIIGNQTLTTLQTNVAVQNAPDYVQQTAMTSAARTQAGGIRDDTILMSTQTFNNTLNQISTLQKSTGGEVNTAVVGNQVVITGTTSPSPPVVPQKSTTTPNTSATQATGKTVGNNSLNQLDITMIGTPGNLAGLNADILEFLGETGRKYIPTSIRSTVTPNNIAFINTWLCTKWFANYHR